MILWDSRLANVLEDTCARVQEMHPISIHILMIFDSLSNNPWLQTEVSQIEPADQIN